MHPVLLVLLLMRDQLPNENHCSQHTIETWPYSHRFEVCDAPDKSGGKQGDERNREEGEVNFFAFSSSMSAITTTTV